MGLIAWSYWKVVSRYRGGKWISLSVDLGFKPQQRGNGDREMTAMKKEPTDVYVLFMAVTKT